MSKDEKKVPAWEEFEYIPDSMAQQSKLLSIAKEAPYIVLALGGGLGILAHGIYNFRKRGRPISQYIVHYRVYVQAYIIGTAVLGFSLHSLKINFFDKKKTVTKETDKEILKG